jgi:two-component system LytT family sensor kinase
MGNGAPQASPRIYKRLSRALSFSRRHSKDLPLPLPAWIICAGISARFSVDPKALAKPARVFVVLSAARQQQGTDVQASGLAPLPPTSCAVKRTKSATKRTSRSVGMRDPRGRALQSSHRDLAHPHPRLSYACADGTCINTNNPISLASGRTISKATLFNVLNWGGWLALGTMLIPYNVGKEGRWPAALDVVTWILCGVVVTLGFRRLLRRARSARLSSRSLAVLVLALSAFGAAVWYVACRELALASLAGIMQVRGFGVILAKYAAETAAQPWLIPGDYWVFYAPTLLTWCSAYVGINSMLDLEHERARSVNALKLADGARLRALQSQLNPHFLFNALNGIATLIRESERTRAADMVDMLGDFLRSTLQKLDSPEIPVSEELAFLQQYLHIQRLRFGSHFQASVDADPDTCDALVPTLILQPLVENAVRHGVLARTPGGVLSVSIRRCDEVLVLTVEDDGPGLGDGGAHPYGVGLKNSAERLAALYGDDAHMSVGARPYGRGFAAVIFLPFRKAPGTPAIPAAPAASAARVAVAV